MEAAEQIFDVLGPDEGRGDEGRAGGVVHRHRRVPARVPGARPGEARGAARRRAARAVRPDAARSSRTTWASGWATCSPTSSEDAVAAASIGQVYRARLHDGRDVAVKVQYPGVGQAVRADLQNLGLIMRVAKRIAPGMDAKAMTAEIRERLTDELDYEHEAQQHRAFARTWRGHPFIYVPARRDRALERARARERVGRRDRLRGGEGARPARRATASARSSSASSSARSTGTATSRATPIPATTG